MYEHEQKSVRDEGVIVCDKDWLTTLPDFCSSHILLLLHLLLTSVHVHTPSVCYRQLFFVISVTTKYKHTIYFSNFPFHFSCFILSRFHVYPRQIPIVLRAIRTPLPRNILLLWWNEFRDICGQRQLFINSLKNFFQVNFYQSVSSTLSNPPLVPFFCIIPCVCFSPPPPVPHSLSISFQ